MYIEAFSADLQVDAGLTGASSTPKQVWAGADHLEGQLVKVVADGAVRADALVEGGAVTLDEPALAVELGLAFAHVIEPLPPSIQGIGSGLGIKLRPVSITLRLLNTAVLYLDTGRGLVYMPFQRFGTDILDAAPPRFTGDITARTLGWRQGGVEPLWRIEQDTPLAFTLLSVSTELSVSA